MRTSRRIPSTSSAYAGPERRKAARIPANYPVRILCTSSTDEKIARYAQSKNISSEGILLSSVEPFRPGTRVDLSIGIPFADATSLPAAQLDGTAVVVRSGPIDPDDDDEFGAAVALKFLQKPTVSTELSMFD